MPFARSLAAAAAITLAAPLASTLPGLDAIGVAEAAFGGKVKNIRIRERNSGSGYRVVVVVQDDNTTNEVNEAGRVVVVVKDDTDSSVSNEEVSLPLTDVVSTVQNHRVAFNNFTGDALDIKYHASIVLQSGGDAVAVVDADLTVADMLASDTDLGDAQDNGWLTDAGDVDIPGGVVNVRAGIRDQGDGTQKLVVKVRGDDGLPAAGIDAVEVVFNEPFEGPAPIENPIVIGTTSSSRTFRVKQAPAAFGATIDSYGDSFLLGAEVRTAGGSLLLDQPLVPVDASGPTVNVALAPDADAAIKPLIIDGISGALNLSVESALWTDAAVLNEDSPAGVVTDLRVGNNLIKTVALSAAATGELAQPGSTVITQQIFASSTGDELFVGVGSCTNPGTIAVIPVAPDAPALVSLTFADDGSFTSQVQAQDVVVENLEDEDEAQDLQAPGTTTTTDGAGDWVTTTIFDLPSGARTSYCNYGCYNGTGPSKMEISDTGEATCTVLTR
jgi:hypothetical protein